MIPLKGIIFFSFFVPYLTIKFYKSILSSDKRNPEAGVIKSQLTEVKIFEMFELFLD